MELPVLQNLTDKVDLLKSTVAEKSRDIQVTSARRDFGSFHSSNVQELLRAIQAGHYIPPSLPFNLPQFMYGSGNTPPFGQEMREKHFLLEEETTFINHGAFGGTLKDALNVAQEWQVHIERQPLRFYDRELLPHLVFVTKRLAEFVGAVKKLLKEVCENRGATLQEESLEFPLLEPSQIITKVEESLQPGTKLAVFDHIPSNAAFINPLSEIIDICHKRGTKVLIDGAHALGVMDLKVSSIGADYYTSNCHKWFCSPKGCAFLYVKQELQNCLQPLVISHGFGFGFSSEYIWTGLKDYSAFLALHTVLDFWESVGLERIRGYINDLVSQAVDLLVNRWKTGLLVPREMIGSMACVRLPECLFKYGYANYEQAEIIQNVLYSRYNIEVPVKALGGKLYVRISIHIYNELKQYQKLADAIEEMTQEEAR
ncbi:probable L-cysteine desulfhydrase, chloroplastic isoform X3 [Scyliorhinus canicula]|uniref:probable L-cysteine desulfhydrase, chloroplastic isoform X3 n=1 Tax=Scyliorhinus canicula TaxID=7830 RepID=UPI0018F710B6|nr:probable L-cysteine desulfhydrase, chloroplastic isoform X3 [Scyliorhinus canicula]